MLFHKIATRFHVLALMETVVRMKTMRMKSTVNTVMVNKVKGTIATEQNMLRLNWIDTQNFYLV